MSNSFDDLRRQLDRRIGAWYGIQESLGAKDGDLKKVKQDIQAAEEAQKILQLVAEQTQQQFQYKISELVTLALQSVFPDPYEFRVKFTQRRNKTEADLVFIRKGEEVDPMEASGGGVVDVAAFALRMSLYTLQKPKSRPTIVMDEPFRFVSRDLQPRVSQLLKELSQRLGLQFIIVTHQNSLIEYADKVFEVTKERKHSKVVVLDLEPTQTY